LNGALEQFHPRAPFSFGNISKGGKIRNVSNWEIKEVRMTRKKQSRGTCVFCGREMSRGGLSRHLQTCAKRQEAQAAAQGREENIYHLLVESADSPDYWLHLEMRSKATLNDLDKYLRAIWLECCGHLSAFDINGIHYTQVFDDGLGWDNEKSMNVRVDKLFRPGMVIPYEYDFGSTTDLNILVLAERRGKPLSRHPIYLMARNQMEEEYCMECGQPAAYMCLQCFYEREDMACELCEEHAETHECWDYGGPMPLVNSPRVGVCGYTGPAEPPY
jgi:hypothetical protein